MSRSPLEALEPRTHTLSNGLEVVVVPMPTVHRTVVEANLRIGPRYERKKQNGISHFLEHMLYRGTPRHPSSHAQALAFERLGGTLVAATYADRGSMAISTPPENFEESFALFSEVYREPILDGIEVEKGIVREEINESLDEDGREIDPDNLIRALAFEDHPLGMPITGTTELLDGFDRELLSTHHRAHYTGPSTVVCVAGPVEPDAMFRLAETHLGSLPNGARTRATPPPPQKKPRFRHVKHKASSQTDIRLGFRAPGERDPAEPAVELLLRTIDDGLSTRLYERVCDARGLCYDVSAVFEGYEDSGLVEIAASSAHAKAADVIDEISQLLQELRDDGPTEQEVKKAKDRHRWQLTDMLDDPGAVADFFAYGKLSGTLGTPAERCDQLESVTMESVRDAAATVFDRAQLSAVAVGLHKKKAQRQLESFITDF